MSGSLANSTFEALAVAAFNLYPMLFIVIFETALTSLFGFSSFSLAKI